MFQVVPTTQVVHADWVDRTVAGSSVSGPAQAAGSEDWARDLATQRAQAKKEKNWARADELRKILLDKGFEARDTKDG